MNKPTIQAFVTIMNSMTTKDIIDKFIEGQDSPSLKHVNQVAP